MREIYSRTSAARRREFVGVLALMLVGTVAELATIGSVIPLLSFVAGSGAHQAAITRVLASAGAAFGVSAFIAAAVLFGAIAIIAGLIRLELSWLTQQFIARLAHDLAVETQRRVLMQPYSFHISHNSSELVSGTGMTELFVFSLVLPLMQAGISAFIAVSLLLGLFYIDPLATAAATAGFAGIYLLVTLATARRLAENSRIVSTAYDERLRIQQESLGGIRDVILDHSQSAHLRAFDRVDARLGRARATTIFIATAPRFIVEALGMVVLAAIVVLVSTRPATIAVALPVLGAFALAAQRLLPLVQAIYTGWSTAAGHRSIIAQVVELLRLPIASEPDALRPLPFSSAISVEDATLSYQSRPDALALSDVSLTVPKGTMVALIGKTGAGKSTLADLMMALLPPSKGSIRIDGTALTTANAGAWQQNIAHVPQAVYLADTTIARNIALSLPDEPADEDRIVSAARKAQLHDFIISLPDGYETLVGERGVRLSGGQRQRLGLARAIYKDAQFLVLDEATSALDELTERAVIEALQDLRREGKTIVIVAHRASTIRHCDLVARLDDGRIVELGTYEQVFATRPAP